jgi:NADH:ubiquinone oxidoreductase subunit E
MRVAFLAGAAILACVAILITDDIVASRRAPRDDHIIKSAVGYQRAAELKRITAARLARKSRDGAVAWALIASAALFLTCAKRSAGSSVPRPQRPLGLGGRPVMRASLHPAKCKPTLAPAAELDLGFIDELIAQHGRTKEAAIPLLGAIQSHYRYLPDEALRRLCELTEITPAQIAGTSSFYAQFRRSPTGKYIVRVCHGTACHISGARQVADELRRYLEIPAGADTDPGRMFTVEEVACLGCCSLAPVLMVDGHTAGRLTPSTACDALVPFAEEESA